MRLDGSTACMAIEGAADLEVFGACVRQVLCPFLKPGDLVVMENLAAHKGSHSDPDPGGRSRGAVPAGLFAGLEPD